MSTYPQFRDVYPLESACIYWCVTDKEKPKRRCTRRANLDDRHRAYNLKSDILSGLWDESKMPQLKDYAKLCCYLQSKHRTRAIKLHHIDDIVTQWALELAGPSKCVLAIPSTPPLARFLPYASTLEDPLSDALLYPLAQHEFGDDTLYMIKRAEDAGLIKIGITRLIADTRFGFFESACGFEPVAVRQIRHVPCVRRVERLVHAELNQYRRECTTCTGRDECGALHTEWFEIDEGRALVVMESWARWMMYANPYQIDGKLKRSWVDLQLKLNKIGLSPTHERVAEQMHKQQAQEDHLAFAMSRLSIGRKLIAYEVY